ncbi:hypothetical protein D3C76_879020 [compost metagenome]
MWRVRIKPLASLLARYWASSDICPETYNATASGPCWSMIWRRRAALWAMAWSMLQRAGCCVRCWRMNGSSMRPGALRGTCAVRPLVQRRPKLLGCCLSPLILLTLPSATLMTMPHPTPQYGQTLRTSLLLMGRSPGWKRKRRRLPRPARQAGGNTAPLS